MSSGANIEQPRSGLRSGDLDVASIDWLQIRFRTKQFGGSKILNLQLDSGQRSSGFSKHRGASKLPSQQGSDVASIEWHQIRFRPEAILSSKILNLQLNSG